MYGAVQRGPQVYDAIGRKVEAARAEADRVGLALRQATERWERSRREEGEDLARMAAVRVEALETDRVEGRLDAADRRALAILGQKQEAIERLDAALDASRTRQSALEVERRARGDALDALRAERARLEESTLAALAETEPHAFQRARAEKAREQARHADLKATQAETDRIEKGRPYEENKLFAYLWKRGYGFPRYKAIPLIRTLDAWVARLSRYDRAHLDYRMLLEIPVRLREHADRLAAAAATEEAALEAVEQEALQAAGVGALDAKIEEHAADLAAKGRELEAEEARSTALREERATFEAGEDAFTREALETVRRQIEGEPLATLRADAAGTPSREDDAIAGQIARRREERERLQPEIERLRREQDRALEKLQELEDVRRRYRRRRYDARDSVFDGGLDAGDLLEKLARGGIVVGDVLGKMNRHQRFEIPTRGRAGSGWGVPRPGPFGGGRRSGGGGGRGGFRTTDSF